MTQAQAYDESEEIRRLRVICKNTQADFIKVRDERDQALTREAEARFLALQEAKAVINIMIERREGMSFPDAVQNRIHVEGLKQAWGLVHELHERVPKPLVAELLEYVGNFIATGECFAEMSEHYDNWKKSERK